jgi:hypothetical protein
MRPSPPRLEPALVVCCSCPTSAAPARWLSSRATIGTGKSVSALMRFSDEPVISLRCVADVATRRRCGDPPTAADLHRSAAIAACGSLRPSTPQVQRAGGSRSLRFE